MKNIFNKTIVTALLLLSVCPITACEGDVVAPIYNEKGQIQVQISSTNCEGIEYKSTINKLKKAGFKNIKIHFIGDIILGLFASEGEIDSIRINSDSVFEQEDFFDIKSVVFLDVHSKKEDLEIIANEVDGQIPAFYNPNGFSGIDKLDAGKAMLDIGFTDVTYKPIQDCFSTSSYDYNQASSFSINGTQTFSDYSFFDVGAPIKISYHTTIGDYCTNGLEHTYQHFDEVKPTCTEDGKTAGEYCVVCNKSISGGTIIPATGHSEIIDNEYVEPTCISEGKTKGSHCSTCGEILSVSETISIDPNCHMNTTIEKGIEATCVSEGTTDYIYCNDCQKIIQNHEAIPLNPDNHKNIIIDAYVAPTETSTGLTEGKHCGDCGKTIVAQETLPKIVKTPAISGRTLSDARTNASSYGLSYKYSDNYYKSAKIYCMETSNGGLTMDIYYNSSADNQLMAAEIVCFNTLASSSAQQSFIKGMAPVLCPTSDSSTITTWINNNISSSSASTTVNGIYYKLYKGSGGGLIYEVNMSNLNKWLQA